MTLSATVDRFLTRRGVDPLRRQLVRAILQAGQTCTTAEACEHLACSRTTLYAHLADGSWRIRRYQVNPRVVRLELGDVLNIAKGTPA